MTQLYELKPHTLSEKEEKIMNKKNMTSRNLWVSSIETILGSKTITWKKQQISLLSAIENMSVIKNSERYKLWNIITKSLEDIGVFAEHELTALITDKYINDQIRNYEKPFTSVILSYQNETKAVENIIHTISTIGFEASGTYYKNKAWAHKLKNFSYTDRYRTLGKLPQINFSEGAEILREVLYEFKSEYGEFFDSLLLNGHIDVYPKKYKQGGAFMSSGTYEPTMIFLNHTDSFDSLQTLAHEVGHAIHSYCTAKSQPVCYQDYSMVTAETASTFFEQLLFQKVYDQSDTKTKHILLEHKLDRITSTVMRQTAFFNFELSLHEHIRSEGSIDSKTIATLFSKHIKKYMGANVNVNITDGYSYVYIGHFRRMFYVYSYAYGQLISSLMFNMYKNDKSYKNSIHDFLCSGASNSVENIYRSIGIEPNNPDVIENALTEYKQDIKTFKKNSTKFRS